MNGIPKKKHLYLDMERMKSIPFEKRTTIRRLAKELDVSKSQVGRWVKDRVIKPRTNAIKPALTDMNKLQRIKFSLSALVLDRNTNQLQFSSMHNIVHIDEKWFYMTQTSVRHYKLDEEEDTHRSCKSKTSLVNQIIPAIKAKWSANASKHIIIQQDNARPHVSNNDPDFRASASSDGFNILLVCQPPNSPDTNINDLGWFRSLQSFQVDTNSYSMDDLVKNVLLSFEITTTITLNKVFLSLQACLIEILKAKEQNNFKLSHMSKDMLIREERLPRTLEVDEVLVKECIHIIIEVGQVEGLTYDISDLMLGLGY